MYTIYTIYSLVRVNFVVSFNDTNANLVVLIFTEVAAMSLGELEDQGFLVILVVD